MIIFCKVCLYSNHVVTIPFSWKFGYDKINSQILLEHSDTLPYRYVSQIPTRVRAMYVRMCVCVCVCVRACVCACVCVYIHLC